MAKAEKKSNSVELTETAVRFLRASTLGAAVDDRDLKTLLAAADAEDRELPTEQMACHVLLREVRKRRMEATASTQAS